MEAAAQETIMKAAQGDIQAFEAIYKRASSMVYGIALRITKNTTDAQEITQDVFIKIYTSLPRFNFKASFKTRAYRIAINTAINVYKTKKRRKAKEVLLNEYTDCSYDGSSLSLGLDQQDTERKIHTMLDALNADQKECIILREIEDLSYKEIADVLKININTVRSRLKRARTNLIAIANNKKGEVCNAEV